MAQRKFFQRMPLPLAHTLRRIYGAIPTRIRYGRAYREMLSLLHDSQWWSRERLQEYQLQQLKLLIQHAYANVPYYRQVFVERNLKPEDIREIDDLRKLPFLTRDIIRENLRGLVARNYPASSLQYETTGGSTGNPLGFYFEKRRTDEIERAFIHTLWARAGFEPGDRCAVLRGRLIDPSRTGEFWEYDPVEHNLYLSAYHMTDGVLPSYIDHINKFKPDFICGYPSAVTLLAQYMIQNSVEPFRTVKAVFCGSENLYVGLRQTLVGAFKRRVFSWYGHTERAVLAGECEQNNHYHIFPEYGIVELIDNGNNAINSAGTIGEVIATGLNNFIFPLIRYKTGDLVSYSDGKCNCGRNYRLLEKVEGRSQEFIVTTDGRTISLTAFVFAQHFEAFSRMKLMQIEQETKGKIKVRIVRTSEFTNDDEAEIRNVMLNSVSGKLDIGFEYVDSIQRTRTGKHRFLIQKLPVGG